MLVWLGVPKIRALYEATYFAGLRKAGMPEERPPPALLTTLAAHCLGTWRFPLSKHHLPSPEVAPG